MKLMHDVSEASTTLYAIYHPHYKEKSGMTKSAYKPSLLRPPLQLLSLPAVSSNYIVKVMKPLYNVQEASITRFAIYHPHYKDKLSNQTRSFVCTVDNFYFLSNFDNLSMASSLFVSDCRACAVRLSLVIKKGGTAKNFLNLHDGYLD